MQPGSSTWDGWDRWTDGKRPRVHCNSPHHLADEFHFSPDARDSARTLPASHIPPLIHWSVRYRTFHSFHSLTLVFLPTEVTSICSLTTPSFFPHSFPFLTFPFLPSFPLFQDGTPKATSNHFDLYRRFHYHHLPVHLKKTYLG
jgi:hypothetical protein